MANLLPSSSQTPKLAQQQPRSSNLALSPLLAMGFLGIATVYFLLPLYWLIISSTKDTGDLFNSFGLWFGVRNSLWANLSGLFTTDNRRRKPRRAAADHRRLCADARPDCGPDVHRARGIRLCASVRAGGGVRFAGHPEAGRRGDYPEA